MDESSSSVELSLHVPENLEFTLEDTLEMLKELKTDRDEGLERIYDIQINNHLFTPLTPSTNVLEEQQQLTSSFINEISNAKPDEYPISDTIDMFNHVISSLTNEIDNIEKRIEYATKKLTKKEEEIERIKEERQSFEKMKEACLAANQIIASKTYEQEIHITNQIFKEVRSETRQVVNELFPDHDHVTDFLAILSSAYFTSGDDAYVELKPEVMDVANYLLEAGLLAYHKYDENKVRLVDL